MRYMVAATKRVIVLADASKFGQVAFFDAFDVDDKFEIITDRPLASSIHGGLTEKGAKVMIAGNGAATDSIRPLRNIITEGDCIEKETDTH